MELKFGENIYTADSIPILLVSDVEMKSYIKGHHVYKHLWTPVINEHLSSEMEPNNIKDKYAVCVKKNNVVIGHLPLGKSGKFAKMIFYFLRADPYAKCVVVVTGKAVILGDGDGMQVPRMLKITGKKTLRDILTKELCDYLK